jgi:hypothetical protein
MAELAAPRWLLLIHQIPPKPDYFRVKVRRRLQRLGAVAIKSSVYALPNSAETLEDLQWLLHEIVADGGEGSICQGSFVGGLSDEAVEDLFRAERASAYSVLAADARELLKALPARRRIALDELTRVEAEIARLRRRLSNLVALDFFGAREQHVVHALVATLEQRALAARATATTQATSAATAHGRTWVTRHGIFVDRIASAWLIERFIDPEAQFKYVAPMGYRPAADELRFDMFEAEYTHVGDQCTFEVLLDRFALHDDSALVAIAEIVHAIDIKDGKFDRPETAGVERLLAGIARGTSDDETRRQRGGMLFTDLYESLQDAAPNDTSDGARSTMRATPRGSGPGRAI